jgi:TRAP-type mannitol/chloroaromatic compound transport system permease large subunit
MAAAVSVFLFLLLIGAPIAIVMVMSGLAGAVQIGGTGFLAIIADRMFSGVAGYLLMAIPYFIFTAELMNQAGLTERLIAFNNALLGRIGVRSATSTSPSASSSQASPARPSPTRSPSARY